MQAGPSNAPTPPIPVRLLVLLAFLVVQGTPSGSALALVEGPDPANRLRVALEDGELTGRRIEGTPTVDGRVLGEEAGPLDWTQVEPWRGYPRTVQLEIGGDGRLVLRDDASGIVVDAQQADRKEGRDRDGGRGGRDAPSHGDAANVEGADEPGTGANASNRSDERRGRGADGEATSTRAGAGDAGASAGEASRVEPASGDAGDRPGPGGPQPAPGARPAWEPGKAQEETLLGDHAPQLLILAILALVGGGSWLHRRYAGTADALEGPRWDRPTVEGKDPAAEGSDRGYPWNRPGPPGGGRGKP